MTHHTDLENNNKAFADPVGTTMRHDHVDFTQVDITTTVESVDSFGPPALTLSPGQTLVNDLHTGLPLSASPPSRSTSSITGDSMLPQNINNNLLSSFSSTHSSVPSTAASRRSSMQMSKPVEVKETLDASVTENAEGGRQLNQYALKEIIGRGAYGIVNLGVDVNTSVQYAIKEFSKSKLRKKDKANLFKLGPRGRGRGRRPADEPAPLGGLGSNPLDLIRGEVAVLKKLNHINIVKLYEVLDDATDDSMYMVFELCTKGILMNVSLSGDAQSTFSDAECRDVFQQMVLGIEYLHEHDIVHRDIKPENLLRSDDGTLKIVDFGVSEMFDQGKDLTRKSAGSPAFMAPELCRHDHGEVSGKAADVWSMGVTLYCLRYGHLPFISGNIIDLQQMIRENELDVSKEQDPRFTQFIKRLLTKDPAERITIDEMRADAWLTNDGKEPLISKDENIRNAVVELTEDDLRGAIRTIGNLATIMKAITKFKRPTKRSSTHSRQGSGRFDDADESKEKTIVGTPIVVTTGSTSISAAEGNGGLDNILAENVRVVPPTPVEPVAKDKDATSLPKPAVEEEAEQKEKDTTAVTTPPSPPEAVLAHITLEDDGEVKIKVEDEKKQDNEHRPIEATASEVTAESGSAAPASHEEEGEGYMECNLETGMCYWVPTKKRVTDDEETPKAPLKEEEEETTTSTAHPEVLAPTPTQPSAEDLPASTPYEHSRTSSPSPYESSSPLRSASSSPAFGSSTSSSSSSTPAKPSVGKLSAARLAFFERKA